jgi:hypothetical protein
MIIDIQEKLCKSMDPEILADKTGNVSILLETARELAIPVLVTEQYPAGLGATIPELQTSTTNSLEKMSLRNLLFHISNVFSAVQVPG